MKLESVHLQRGFVVDIMVNAKKDFIVIKVIIVAALDYAKQVTFVRNIYMFSAALLAVQLCDF